MAEPLSAIVELMRQVRVRQPIVHYMPNVVTAGAVADALTAAGAAPIMAMAPEEVGTLRRDVLALNLGTPTADRLAALELAARAATHAGAPVVLDPVGVGASPFRLTAARRILDEATITVIRLNAGEAVALLDERAAGRGVDAGEVTLTTATLAARLAQRFGLVVAVTGATDAISDGRRTLLVDNGHTLLSRTSGAGCIATGLVAACVAVATDRLLATVAGLVWLGVAGERAARLAAGPGTFRPLLLDAIGAVDASVLLAEARLRCP